MLSPRSFVRVDMSYLVSTSSYFSFCFSLLKDQSCGRLETHRKTRGRVFALFLLCLYMCMLYRRKEGPVFKEGKSLHFILTMNSSDYQDCRILLLVQQTFSQPKFFSKTPVRKRFAQLSLDCVTQLIWKLG